MRCTKCDVFTAIKFYRILWDDVGLGLSTNHASLSLEMARFLLSNYRVLYNYLQRVHYLYRFELYSSNCISKSKEKKRIYSPALQKYFVLTCGSRGRYLLYLEGHKTGSVERMFDRSPSQRMKPSNFR
jgi:hypothetical protein